MLVANELARSPIVERIPPAITIARCPYRFVRTDTMGPENIKVDIFITFSFGIIQYWPQ